MVSGRMASCKIGTGPKVGKGLGAAAQAAGIRFPFRNWKDIVEQPYEVTARIPMKRPRGTATGMRKRPRIVSSTPAVAATRRQ